MALMMRIFILRRGRTEPNQPMPKPSQAIVRQHVYRTTYYWGVLRRTVSAERTQQAKPRPLCDTIYRTSYYWGVVLRTVSAKYTGKVKDWDLSQAESNSYDKTRQITINGGDQQDGYYFFYFILFIST